MAGNDRSLYKQLTVEDSSPIRAIVVDRMDPRMEGRIGVIIPRLMPNTDPNKVNKTTDTTPLQKTAIQNEEIQSGVASQIKSTNIMWARPVHNGRGNYEVPYKGKNVYVYMEDGDPSKLFYLPHGPSLTGEVIAMDQVRSTADAYDPEKKPNIQVLKEFADGTTVYYNENSATKEFEVRYANGFFVSIATNPTSQQIEAKTQSGHNLVLDQLKKNIRIDTAGGHKILMNDSGDVGISATTSGGHKINASDSGGSVSIRTSGGHNITAKNGGLISLKAHTGGQILIGNGGVAVS